MSDGIIPWEAALVFGALLAVPLVAVLISSIQYFAPPPWDACGVCSRYSKWCPHKDQS